MVTDSHPGRRSSAGSEGAVAETHAAKRTVVTSMSKLPNLSEASGQEVVAWAREGDEDAYREMVRRYSPPVFDLVYRMVGHRELAEDLTQETFVKPFRALDRHGPERKPSAWILRIANNTAIDYVGHERPAGTARGLIESMLYPFAQRRAPLAVLPRS